MQESWTYLGTWQENLAKCWKSDPNYVLACSWLSSRIGSMVCYLLMMARSPFSEMLLSWPWQQLLRRNWNRVCPLSDSTLKRNPARLAPRSVQPRSWRSSSLQPKRGNCLLLSWMMRLHQHFLSRSVWVIAHPPTILPQVVAVKSDDESTLLA